MATLTKEMAEKLRPHVDAYCDGEHHLNFRSLIYDIGCVLSNHDEDFDAHTFWDLTEIDKKQNKAITGK